MMMEMERGPRSSVLDKNHGFMKYIIRNQIDRDNFDREEKLKQRLKDSDRPNDDSNLSNNALNQIQQSSPNNDRFEVKEEDAIIREYIEEELDKVPSKLGRGGPLFNLEFLTKTGDTVNVKVGNNDSPEDIVQRVVNRYPLNEAIRNALIRRLGEEIKTMRSRGA